MWRAAPIVAALAVACAPPSAKPAVAASSAESEQAIAAVLDDFHAAAAAADEARYFTHLSDDSVFLGTDQSERWSKAEFRAYAHPHFAKGKAWRFRAVRRTVVLDRSGAIAWFDEDLATERLGPARGSGVLALENGHWRIVQYNLALTIPNERFDLVHEAAGGATVAAPAAGDALLELGWLAGAWVGKNDAGEIVEELWTAPSGGTMIGSGRSTKDGKTTFFEHLRIEARGGAIVYVAQPLGRSPTEFTRRGAGADQLVFENPAHDWPKRVSYQRLGSSVRVRTEGGPGQRVDQWTMTPAVIARSRPRS